MSFKILCCDGGGIRGVITALLIQDLDRSFGIVQGADGFAGTSTGGLISLGLASNVGIDAIVDLYQNEGAKIFEPNGWWLDAQAKQQDRAPARSAEELLGSGPGIFKCQYVNTGLQAVAQKLVGNGALSSASRFVAVNSARLWDASDNNWAPCTISNGPNNIYRGISMVDAALATSAAPTYFPPYQVEDFGYFADGGTFANNPSMTAVVEAIYQGYATAASDIVMLSLGTGDNPVGVPPGSVSNPLNWGATHWLWPFSDGAVPATALLNLTMDATAELAAIQAQQLLGNNYMRGNVPLAQPFGLDDYKNVGELVRATQNYIETSPDWAAVRSWVGQNWA
ncbi:putative acylesterase/phospholipase RssA [Variovorax paradoxus]|uniref:patatin-like phospholipase family protein n=1 Tax=Variovorax paradoxus TaxID=34073 RepID=UPI0027925DB0|nr:patatin-like phospholipase family protein [Variovorax paradoxus]MDQ0568810.1 putative acylesterase/phospholipase RssA [Variovorax paradoxus]